ncbi:hypothetical protein [Streptomyces sp. NPDC006333]|uniref:hypothetical protein n=1 Tax=Streptomyces sp. NPDC006333 TaxID=3156753 RepID=UPI0033BBA3B4
MVAPTNEQSPQRGLLDLSVDLSVPEVYSGTDFTLYLHIKNPFSIPVWVQSVELSLPTQLQWRSSEGDVTNRRLRNGVSPTADALMREIQQRNKRIESLTKELRKLPEGASEQADRIRGSITRLTKENERDTRLASGAPRVSTGDDATVNLYGSQSRGFDLSTGSQATINVYNLHTVDEPERVPLTGSLPKQAALEPGCTDVWTIRLGTGKSPFFLPATYHLQLTVIYGVEPLKALAPSDLRGEFNQDVTQRRVFSNTTSFTVPVKAALWSVMLGGVTGGAVGSIGRSLQDAQTVDSLFSSNNLGPAVGAFILAIILSGAAIIFSARKSDAQSFVTVEDFWGGLLVGFLIGYSGTAAFSDITRVKI